MSKMKGMEEKPVSAKVFKSGLTWRSIFACIYMIFVFTPAIIWFRLSIVGVTVGGAVSFCTLLIFVEIARLSRNPITKHEAVILFNLAILASLPANYFINMIYREYFVLSDIAERFGISEYVPTWYAPPAESGVWSLRTFLHPAWIMPLSVLIASSVFAMFSGLFFGLLARELYIETERLPFPLQLVNVDAVVTLTERKEDRLAILSYSSIIALIYGALLYTIPTASGAFGNMIRFIPIPWIDFTYEIEKIWPGGAFGVGTDIALLAMGLMLPFRVVISMFIGSLAIFAILNPLMVSLGMTKWATRWTPGMDFSLIWRESTLWFWAGPVIGMALAAGITPILMHPRIIVTALKSIFRSESSKSRERVSGDPPSKWLVIGSFVFGVGGLIALNWWLVPDFPVWALVLFQMIFPFLLMITQVRMLGVTGQSFSPPYLSQLTILFSGYQKYDAWFLPFQLTPGTWWCTNFKICQLTETKVSSWIKAYLICWPLAMVMVFVYVSFFWRMAPIPSAQFPAPAIEWPVTATYQAIWITRPIGFFDPVLIIEFFIGTAVLTALFDFLHLPISMLSVVVGVNTPLPSVFTMFIGAIVGMVISKILGKTWFNRYRATISAGLFLGEGIAVVIGTALALLARAIWMRPY